MSRDQPGVLNRVASLFRRRGFNIHSLSVGTSRPPGVSRMTDCRATDDAGGRRIDAQLDKLIRVRVEDLSDRPAVVRDLALIRVAATHDSRAAVMQLVQVFDGRIVDVSPGVAGGGDLPASEAKVDGLVEVLRPYGVLEMVRTGRVAMDRGAAAEPWQPLAPRPDAATADGISCSV